VEKDEGRRRRRRRREEWKTRLGEKSRVKEGGRDIPGYWEHAELGGKGCRMLKGTASRKCQQH
jgi:hypothetical protein